jgi:hypothetical protein
MEFDAGSRSPATGGGWHRLHLPVGVFLIVFGATRVASLLDWSGRHRDAARMLGVGDGTTTVLLVGSALGELLLTVAAVLAVHRRRDVWLLAGLTGWSAESLLLTAVAAVAGDVPRLVEHAVFLLAFGGLLAATYRWSAAARASRDPSRPESADPVAVQHRPETTAPEPARHHPESTAPGPTPHHRGSMADGATRRDLPASTSDVTHRDLARPADHDRRDGIEPGGDATRRDLTGPPDETHRDEAAESTSGADHRDGAGPASDTTRQDIRVRKPDRESDRGG